METLEPLLTVCTQAHRVPAWIDVESGLHKLSLERELRVEVRRTHLAPEKIDLVPRWSGRDHDRVRPRVDEPKEETRCERSLPRAVTGDSRDSPMVDESLADVYLLRPWRPSEDIFAKALWVIDVFWEGGIKLRPQPRVELPPDRFPRPLRQCVV